MLEQLDNKVGGQAVEGENGVANEAGSDSAGGDGQSTDRALVGLQEDSGNDDAGQEGGGSDHSSGESGEAGADGGTNPSESEAARAGAGSDPSSAEAARADVASGTDGSGAKVDSSTASESASAEAESQQQQAQKGTEEEGQWGALRLRRLLAVEADQGVRRGRLLQKEEMAGGQLNLDQGASTSESLLGGASHAAAHRLTSHVAEMGGMAAGAVDAAVLDEIDADGTADTMELSDSWERAVQNMPPVVHKVGGGPGPRGTRGLPLCTHCVPFLSPAACSAGAAAQLHAAHWPQGRRGSWVQEGAPDSFSLWYMPNVASHRCIAA